MIQLHIIHSKIQYNLLCNNVVYLSIPKIARYCWFLHLFTYVCNIYAHVCRYLLSLYICI